MTLKELRDKIAATKAELRALVTTALRRKSNAPPSPRLEQRLDSEEAGA